MKKLLLLTVSMLAIMVSYAQRTISGSVKDDKGNPVQGASVQVKGTRTGTTTKADGTFNLVVPANARTLVISFVGFVDQEIPTNDRSPVNVSLLPSSSDLAEVVLTGYGNAQKKKNITASITTVSGKELENKPFTSVDQMFAGKVAGLIAPSFSGQPGAAQPIRIRGIGSVSASSSPLFVVDGV